MSYRSDNPLALERTDDLPLHALAREGDQAAAATLVSRYSGLIAAIADKYFLPGGSAEDVMAEGMLGFARAINDFQPEIGTPFKAFAMSCVERQIITAVKTHQRLKHGPLNDAKPIHEPLARHQVNSGPGALTLEDTLGGRDTAAIVIALDDFRTIKRRLQSGLSRNEEVAAVGCAVGATHREMADAIGKPGQVKAIDNAIQRVRRKLKAEIEKDAA